MNRLEIAKLCCKVLAVIIVCQAAYFFSCGLFLMVALIISSFSEGGFDDIEFFQSLMLSLPTITLCLLAWFLWKKSEVVAKHMVSESPEPVSALEINSTEILKIGLTISGIFIFVEAFRELLGNAFMATQTWITWDEMLSMPSTFVNFVTMLFAVWLILGVRGITNAVHWLRKWGQHNYEQDEVEKTSNV